VSNQLEPNGERRADVVRRIVMGRERAPRSPRMERAFKRLIWRYTGLAAQAKNREERDATE
jgi:hypothetical protein